MVLQIYDYAQMFDLINLKKAVSDIYDAGLKEHNIVLIREANKEVNMAVNTPSGPSERQIIKNNVLQGDTWGSLMASVCLRNILQSEGGENKTSGANRRRLPKRTVKN